MQELFMVEATKYQVFPLDNSLATRMVTQRPKADARRREAAHGGATEQQEE